MDTISFASETFEVHESGKVTYPVTLVREGAGVESVKAEVKLGSSTRKGRATLGSDYESGSVFVTWDSGDKEPKVVDLKIIKDPDSEPLERVNLSFGEVVGATKGGILSAIAVIQNNSGTESGDETTAIGGIVDISNLANYGALPIDTSKLKMLPLKDLQITASSWGGGNPGNLTAMLDDDSSNTTDWGTTYGQANIGRIQLDLGKHYTGVATVKAGYMGPGVSLFGSSNGKSQVFAGGKYLNSQSEEELVEVQYRFSGRYLDICAMDLGTGQVKMRGYGISVQVV